MQGLKAEVWKTSLQVVFFLVKYVAGVFFSVPDNP